MLRLPLLLLMALLLSASTQPNAARQSAERSGKPIPASYFGMHIQRADRGTAWPGKEIGSWRLWDARVNWVDLEPRPGEWDFSRLDRYVAMAGLAGAEVLMPFGMTPAWASARPTDKGIYRPQGDTAEPRRIEDWERYVRTVANRYKGRIRHFEVWNEVNAGTGFFGGTPHAMFELQKAAYQIVKEVDPDAVLVSPSSVGEAAHQLAWFEDYLALGAADYADVIGYHFYQPRKKPEAIVGLVQKVKAAMARRGAGAKPLWNTESGYRMDLGHKKLVGADPSWPALDPQQAEAYVARALILGWWAGLDRFYWYAWDSVDLGLVHPDGQVTPAGRAYLATARWLIGARMRGCEESRGVWVCELNRDGRRAWLVWNENDTSKEWRATTLRGAKAVETLRGDHRLLKQDAELPLDGTPQLLTEDEDVWGKAL
ncbi:MAG: beta-galactosidase [Gammaproteobacteria bacterium]|nr:beta-galactosidase [Gammaproteobacteria bacterium]